MKPKGLPISADNTVDIAQTLTDGDDVTGPYFATLYDKVDHIPVYSAYTLTAGEAKQLNTHKREELGDNIPWRSIPGLLIKI